MSKVLNNQHTPSCDVDGSYKPVQCNHVTKQCWCVNNDGNEIMGYRTTNNKMPRCPGDKQGMSVLIMKWSFFLCKNEMIFQPPLMLTFLLFVEPPTTASPIEGRKWRSL